MLVPLALMEDSYFNVDAMLANLLGIRLGRLFNQQCTVGTGVSSPTGVVTAAVAAGNTVNLSAGAAIAYNDLVNMEHAVDPDYRYNPSSYWMLSDSMLKIIKKLVDLNTRPLWQPGISSSFQRGAGVQMTPGENLMPTILDHPYIINQDMAVPGTGNDSLLFGDMSLYKVREVAEGTTLLRLVERYADFLQVGFIAFQRFDGNLIDAGTHPIAVGVNQ